MPKILKVFFILFIRTLSILLSLNNMVCGSNLIIFTDYLVNVLVNGIQVDVVYTDIYKIFDKINHALLVAKLEILSYSDIVFKCCFSYLSNGPLAVRVDYSYSSVFY